jgi:UDP-N-acetylmuramyl tripeptide synthase
MESSGHGGAGGATVRDRVARSVARVVGTGIRVSGAGGGSALPGIVLDRLSPGFVERRVRAFPDGVVVVSGTNGKTTTASMLRSILRAAGVEVAGNESGSNLRRGIASALVEAPTAARMGVFEVDEAALPGLVSELRPRILVLTNVFRDQLDRFGETEAIAAHLAAAIRALPPGAQVVANADDPLLWHRAREHDGAGFGVEPMSDAAVSAADAEPEACPRCGATLRYSGRTIAHLGRARCPSCSWASVPPEYEARILESRGLAGITVDIRGQKIDLVLGGVHNAYNAAAAIAAADALGIPVASAARALAAFRPRFGRSEEFSFSGHRGWVLLVKNPAGAGVVIREVVEDPRIGAAVVAISDQIADGRDVSWIWDADFERLAEAGMPIIPAGRRADDVAVRLRYAGAASLPAERDPESALRAAVGAVGDGRGVAVLATYTAMLDVRRTLTRSRRRRLEDAP